MEGKKVIKNGKLFEEKISLKDGKITRETVEKTQTLKESRLKE